MTTVAQPEAPARAGLRIPSLDGLRAISIVLVLLLHLAGTRHFVGYEVVEPFDVGNLGVRVFFVISGFLITSLLLDELQRTQRISLKDFYIRRVFRIFPAFYAYIAVATALWAAGLIAMDREDFFRSITFTVNYRNDGTGSWYVGHLWSLSVEEQFYLLWPATLALGGRRRGMQIAAVVFFAVPVIRFILWTLVPEYRPNVGRTFETVADALAGGCLLAGLRQQLWDRRWYRQFLESRWFVLAPVLIVLTSMLVHRPRTQFGLGLTINIACIAMVIDWSVRNPESSAGRILNSRPMVAIGVLSYSIYLWQQFFLLEGRLDHLIFTWFPLNLVLALTAAVLSYKLIEEPCLRWRKRFRH